MTGTTPPTLAVLLIGYATCLVGCKDKTVSQAAGSGSSVGSDGSALGASGSGGDASVPATGSSSAGVSGSDVTSGGSNASTGIAPGTGSGSVASADSGGASGSAASAAATTDTNVGSADTSGSAVAATFDAGVTTAPAAVPATATTALDDDNTRTDVELRIAFANHVPKLPAVSADGEWIADYGSDAVRPMRPSPIYVRVARLDAKGKSARLEIVDEQMAEANADAGDWETNPPPAAVAKVLRERAAAVVARLHGFASLSSIETRGSTSRSARVGALKLASTEKKGELLVVLTDARGKTLQREQIRSYSDGTHPGALEGGTCEYRPRFQAAYLDQAKRRLFVVVAFRWREECTAQEPRFVAWELPAPAPR